MRKLGKNQLSCLEGLKKHKGWKYWYGVTWVWDTQLGTQRIMNSLVKRGLAVHDEDAAFYQISNAGVDVLAKLARGIKYEDIG